MAMEMTMELKWQWQDQSTDTMIKGKPTLVKYEPTYSFCAPISGPRLLSLDIWTSHSARRTPTKSDASIISAHSQDAP